jgi:hypothetical protein
LPSRTIYPSIPDPGNTLQTIIPCLIAMKQTLQMIIINAQNPNPNYTPSSAAQIFVTNAKLQQLGVTPKTVQDQIAMLRDQLDALEAQMGG